jgi:hypothetical protein
MPFFSSSRICWGVEGIRLKCKHGKKKEGKRLWDYSSSKFTIENQGRQIRYFIPENTAIRM